MNEDTLRARLEGALISADEPDFRRACDALTWNGRKPDRRARYILHAATAEDVQDGVRFAAANGLTVSPRGGGHHFTGIAAQSDLVIDLSAIDHLRLDVEGRTAEVGPAIDNRRLAAALDRHGLAFPVGHCGTVAISGYLLSGGVGWNSGAWGIACFSVEAADIVLADGTLHRTSATEEPDLFWAVRGAGPGFFGIVTSYRVRLQEAPKSILTTVRVYPAAAGEALSAWAETAMAAAPANVEFTVKVGMDNGPDGPTPTLAAIANVFAGSEAEARRILGEVGRGAPPAPLAVMAELPTPIAALYDMTAQSTPPGRRYAVDTLWSDAGLAGLVENMAASMAVAPSPESFALLTLRSPRAVAPGEAAFSRIGRIFGSIYTVWKDAAEDERQIAWMRQSMARSAPLTTGTYVGESDLDLPGRRTEIHAPAAAARLAVLRQRYDPARRFGAALWPLRTKAVA